MAHAYQAVGWNRQKRLYDACLLVAVVVGLVAFAALTLHFEPDATAETAVIRAFGATALVLLHVILSIGPACRLDPRLLPLLYNRRHMGVTLFVLALVHGGFALVQYHGFGVLSPLVSLFAGDVGAHGFSGLPFQPFGAAALAILFVMAATSHDFWLANLTAPVWKALHMLVYLAYALVVLHVALGVLQSDRSPVLVAVLGLGLAWILALHLWAAARERSADRERSVESEFVDVCALEEIPEKRAKTVCVGGERVAVFRYDGRISALSNACQHQNGPLGEGRVLDGCVVCPWHGYQYEPASGRSPAPFTEKVPTFDVRVEKGRVLVRAKPNPAGTHVEPARIDGAGPATAESGFFIGWSSRMPADLARRLRPAVVGILVVAMTSIALLAAFQRELRASRFEFGVLREFRGVIEARPYPMLRVERPGSQDAASHYLLVAPFKHGAQELAASFDGQEVRLSGSLAYHDDRTLIEVEPGSIELVDGRANSPASTEQSLGRMTLRGEIVDSKCHLGVMNPGERRTHRACAKLCIRGGIPPILWVEDGSGRCSKLLLVGADGRAVNGEVLELVGDPVEITGEVVRAGDWLVLKAEPMGYKRVDG